MKIMKCNETKMKQKQIPDRKILIASLLEKSF